MGWLGTPLAQHASFCEQPSGAGLHRCSRTRSLEWRALITQRAAACPPCSGIVGDHYSEIADDDKAGQRYKKLLKDTLE